MSGLIRGITGKQSGAQKRLQRAQENALQSQRRASNAALEDGAVVRAEQAASGRRLRGLGRRALAFAGSELGVSDNLAGAY